MLKIGLSGDRLIFNMGSIYLGKTVFILRRGPDPLCDVNNVALQRNSFRALVAWLYGNIYA